ncbi:MAG: ATP-binding protein [Lachnospiraceae bacterium]|nr:ATP-binding protein [Lachnospiraceae bacterium]
MERKVLQKLIEWKNRADRKPLLLTGARQVGKTWIAREFGNRFFANTVYINFDREKSLKTVLEQTLNPRMIISAIGALSGERIEPQKTLIIFDEVQEEPRALTALKYFCEEAPEYYIIATGSFMGIALHHGTSFPVGKIQTQRIYPLTYTEFLTAMNREGLAELLEKKDIESITAFRDTYIDYLRMYYIIGGMPEAVKVFSEHLDYNSAREIQTTILDLYRQDFSKHAPVSAVPRLNQVWDSIPSQLSKENRKFIYGQIAKGARSKDFELAIMWLSDCGLIHLVHRVSKPGMPLKAYEELSAFKIFLNDIGLLGALGDLPPAAVVNGNRIFSEFKGAMTEQYVLQQLIGEMKLTPYYYSAENSRGEIDFLIQKEDEVLPIEVKAEENLQAKSLKAFIQKYKTSGVRISMSDYREHEWLTNYPLYAFAQLI